MRALLIANSGDADPGFIGQRFRHHGFAFTECHREHPDEWPALDGHDLVLMLGSEWSVYWPHVAQSVDAEAALIRAAHARGLPQFGICFGNQTMAHALGGTVERARTAEIGWYDIVSDVPESIASGPWFQWHYDVVTVPPGAHELARTAVGPQAWKLGRSFSTQFHPEVNESIIARWTSGAGADEIAAFGASVDDLIAQTRNNVAVSREHADHLVDRYLDGLF
ncbi:MAG: putative amino transferase [Ilumatobacteraceae bacterium]|nr:putative amino transferase [Ilumatobacteraceae bacterium]